MCKEYPLVIDQHVNTAAHECLPHTLRLPIPRVKLISIFVVFPCEEPCTCHCFHMSLICILKSKCTFSELCMGWQLYALSAVAHCLFSPGAVRVG